MRDRFVKYNPNPLNPKEKFYDGVFRALIKATGKDWFDIFDEMIPIARSKGLMLDAQPCWEEFLSNNGFRYYGIKAKKGMSRPTVDSFTENHEAGTYVVRVARHIVCVKDGQYFDTWDSGDNSLYGYWMKEE